MYKCTSYSDGVTLISTAAAEGSHGTTVHEYQRKMYRISCRLLCVVHVVSMDECLQPLHVCVYAGACGCTTLRQQDTW